MKNNFSTKMALSGKVALITGGASGIGASCVEQFLKSGVKGVVIADINENVQIVADHNEKYGDGKVVFIRTDVANKESFKNAFEKAIESFNQIDILVNCAGMLNEIEWEKVIQINLVGTTYGCLLAINDYFPKYKSSSKAFVINIASVTGVTPASFCPHYASSKHGIVGLTRSLGSNDEINAAGHYLMALCPASTDTPMIRTRPVLIYRRNDKERAVSFAPQKPESVAQSVIRLIEEPENGSVWSISEGVLLKIDLPDVSNLEKILVRP